MHNALWQTAFTNCSQDESAKPALWDSAFIRSLAETPTFLLQRSYIYIHHSPVARQPHTTISTVGSVVPQVSGYTISTQHNGVKENKRVLSACIVPSTTVLCLTRDLSTYDISHPKNGSHGTLVQKYNTLYLTVVFMCPVFFPWSTITAFILFLNV